MKLNEQGVVTHVERLTMRELRLWVREGLVRPAVSDSAPVFDELEVARISLLCDLSKEMAFPCPPCLRSLRSLISCTARGAICDD